MVPEIRSQVSKAAKIRGFHETVNGEQSHGCRKPKIYLTSDLFGGRTNNEVRLLGCFDLEFIFLNVAFFRGTFKLITWQDY